MARYNKPMQPEELKQQIAQADQQEKANSQKMHDIMLSHQRMDQSIANNKQMSNRHKSRKMLVTIIAIIVLVVLAVVYFSKHNPFVKTPEQMIDADTKQALDRMEEVQKSSPEVTNADIIAAEDYMAKMRAQEKASQSKTTTKKK